MNSARTRATAALISPGAMTSPSCDPARETPARNGQSRWAFRPRTGRFCRSFPTNRQSCLNSIGGGRIVPVFCGLPGQRSCCKVGHGLWRNGEHVRRVASVGARRHRAADFRKRRRVGNPDECRPPDSKPVRDRRLLGLPARAGSGQPGTGRDDRAPGGKRRPRADAPLRGPGRARGRADAAAGLCRRGDASALQVLSGSGRRSLPFFSRRAHRRSRAAARRADRADHRAADLRRRHGAHAGHRRHAARPDRQRSADAGTVRRAGAPASGRARAESVLELGFRHREPVPPARSGVVAGGRQQSDRPAATDSGRPARRARLGARPAQPHQLRLPPDAGVPALDRTRGARGTPASCGPARSRISRRSSACTNRCRSIPAAWGSSRAIISRARPISAFRWSASGSITTRPISVSGSIETAGSTRTTSTSITGACRCSPPGPTESP